MNINNLKKTLPLLLKNKLVPYLHGAQGIGKTSMVRQYCFESSLKFIPLYLATQDQGDLVGLLNKNDNGTVSHLPPEWMMEAQEGEGVIFLDECFPGNAQVLTSKGPLSISQIYKKFQDGESILVKSFNEVTKAFEFKKVTNAWNKGKKEVVGLKMNTNNTFNCTDNHPILTSVGYKKAKDLQEKDLIVSHIASKEKTGTPALGYMVFSKHIKATNKLDKNKKCYVYDLEVEDNHNFVVCTRKHSNGIVVHNCNRAHPDVLQVMYPFLQTGKIHRHGIGPGWKIIAAGNYSSNKFNTTDMSDAALLSRFCHIDVKPDISEFCEYAENLGQESIASFLRDNSNFLISGAGDSLDMSTIPFDPRAWMEKVAPLLDSGLGDLEYEVLSGCIGSTAAAMFLTYHKKNEKPISILKVLDRYNEIRPEVLNLITRDGKETRLDLLNTAITELISRLEKTPHLLHESRIENLHAFLLDIPIELTMAAIASLGKLKFTNKVMLLDDAVFCKKLQHRV